jgi:glycosyl hydrolase family 59 (putative galactocerebrosidase)
MKFHRNLLAGFAFVLTSAALAQSTTKLAIDFEKFAVGAMPAGFTSHLTGQGTAGKWEIREDSSAPGGPKVLAQTSTDNTDYRFPVLVYDAFTAKDVEVSVACKAVAGKVDQACGLVARFADKGNYYIARANALENNVRLYHVVAGRRVQFAGVNHAVSSGQWHTLALEIKGAHFRVSFDGKVLFEADDKTFAGAGKVGVWTKADSVTHFDNFAAVSFDAK